MVLWGQSAGGNAVITYSYANPDDPIVTGLIADSGAPPGNISTNTTSFSTMAASLGCGNLTATVELSCMQNVDALAIQKYVADYSGGMMGNRLGGMVADNITVFANNTERLVQGRIARVVSHHAAILVCSSRLTDILHHSP
jgi:carboxylesterase type B